MNKRGQSEVITTVLIILLVLAAVFIVWTAVRGLVQKGGGGIEQGAACIDTDLQITSATNAASDNLKIERGTGTGAIVKVIVAGTASATTCDASAVGEYETATCTISELDTAAAGAEVKIAPVINGKLCPVVDTAKVTAAAA